MHPFIPYVPKTTEGVTETDWQLALSTWNSSLSNLLRATDKSFLKQITTDASLHHFFETFLRYHASGTADVATGSTAEIQLAKSVLVTFVRLSELSYTDAPITSPPNLINLATVYGKTNVQTTRTVFGNLNVRLPQFVAQFLPLVPATLDCLHRIQQLYVKDSTIKSANGATPDTKAHDVVQNIDILLGVAFTLDSLFAASFPIAHIFYDHTDFLSTIIDLYDTTLPGICDVLGAEKGGGSLTHRSKIGGVKVALVSMMNHLLDACFFSHLGYVSSDDDSAILIGGAEPSSTKEDLPETVVERFNDMMMWWFDRSNLEAGRAFDTAPLVMDLEVECNLSGKLARIKREKFKEDEASLEYLTMSFEQIRNTNQAKETRKERAERIRRMRAVRETRKRHTNGTAGDEFPGSNEHDASDEYIHRTMLISELREIFNHLGEGFIEACLIANGDNVEVVTNQLLEKTLPKELDKLDRSLARVPMKSVPRDVANVTTTVQNLALGNDPLKTRHNVFDNDDFDVFAGKSLDKGRVNLGKKARGTANQMLDDKSFVRDFKQNIIESAYNVYDDELDDTYDDVGRAGPLDPRFVDEYDDQELGPRSAARQQADPGILHERDLVHIFTNDPSLFERSARRSAARENLRRVTRMSDEQLEGWFIMFGRNPRRQQIMDKYAYELKQTELSGSEGDESESEDEDEGGEGGGSGPSRPSGSSQRGRGRPPRHDNRPPRTEAQQRAWKEKRGSRGRQRGHDRKMARGMGGPVE